MTGRLAQICRHPIKGHGREDLASVRLLAGECLPWDRHWAVAHEAAQIQDGWNPCVNFARGAKAPALMAITSQLDEASGVVTLAHPDRGEISFDPDAAQDLPRFLDWVRPLNPQGRAQPVQIVSAGRGMTDSDFPSISVLSTASLADLSVRMGQDLSPHRFRGNLWLDGAEPWAEFGWIGRTLRIGGAVLRLEERITRCKATTVDPETGLVAGDTLGALDRAFGHQDFGVYAVVIEGGPIAVGDEWSLI
jgi:uncharacterized protein YcbX